MRQRCCSSCGRVPCPVCDGTGCGPRRWPSRSPAAPIAELDRACRSPSWPTCCAGRRGRRPAESRGGRDHRRRPGRRGSRCCSSSAWATSRIGRPTPTLSARRAAAAAARHRSCARGCSACVYVLDEPSAGLHPADAEPLLDGPRPPQGRRQLAVRRRARHRRRTPRRLGRRRRPGRRRAAAAGCSTAARSPGSRRSRSRATRRFLFPAAGRRRLDRAGRDGRRLAARCAASRRHNLRDLDVDVPLGVLTAVTGVSGSGKSTLVTQVLADVVARPPRRTPARVRDEEDAGDAAGPEDDPPARTVGRPGWRRSTGWSRSTRARSAARRAPTSRPTPACSTRCASCSPPPTRRGRAATAPAGSPSTSPGGRCETCQGEGFVAVELLFLPGTYAPCPTCHGARYNPETLEVTYRGSSDRRRAGPDRRRGGAFLADVPAVGAQPARRCATWGWATCASASRRPSCPAARRSGSSSPPSCSGPGAATRSTCWTSRPPACTRPTSSC